MVGGPCVLLPAGTDKGAVLHTGHIIDRGAVQIAVGQKRLVQLFQLARGAGLGPERVDLFLAAVDPDHLIGLGHRGHISDPVQDRTILRRCHREYPLENALVLFYRIGGEKTSSFSLLH